MSRRWQACSSAENSFAAGRWRASSALNSPINCRTTVGVSARNAIKFCSSASVITLHSNSLSSMSILVQPLASTCAAAIGSAQQEILHRIQIVQLADHTRDQTYRARLAPVDARQTRRMTDRDVIRDAPTMLAIEIPVLPAQVQRAVNKLLLQNVRHTVPETHASIPVRLRRQRILPD